MFEAFRELPLSWSEIVRRTFRESIADDCLGLAAQLAFYFFLALFPAILFLLALASFFSLSTFADDVVRALQPLAPQEVLVFFEEQLRRISDQDSGGLLTLGLLGAVWSSSAALVAIVDSLNRAYDIEEGRPWWKVRLTAMGLTVGVALFVLLSFALVLAGPTVADYLAANFGLGAVFEWTWKILQWPLVFLLVTTGIGLIYYSAPDADQDWVWVTPGAVAGTLLWFAGSLVFKVYVANFADYNASYGAVGGVIVLLLWFYVSSLAILVGAEMNAEIEHASPYGKAPGEKVPGQKRKIGVAAARAYKERLEHRRTQPVMQPTFTTRNERTQRWTMMGPKEDHRTLGQLFTELADSTRTLIQQEIQLAKTELGEKASTVGRHAALIAAGGLLAYAGLLTVVAALVLGLVAMGLAPWAAALLGSLLAIGMGYMLIRSGLSALQRVNMTPDRTIQTLRETSQWAKGHS